MKRIGIYIDGFNYYYGVYKDKRSPFKSGKWLDISKLADAIASDLGLSGRFELGRYFTAAPHDPPHDPTRSARQRVYLDALDTIEGVSIHESFHKWVEKKGTQIGIQNPPVVDFKTREEKGSDVSLGSYLVRDTALNLIDIAIVLSNDSDLKDSVRIARTDFTTTVLVINPCQSTYNSVELRKASNKKNYRLNRNLIGACQLPNPVVGPNGVQLYKPATW